MGATKAANYSDWALLYDGKAAGLNAFGEVTLDRSRIATGERVVSVLYQVSTSGSSSAVRVADFSF